MFGHEDREGSEKDVERFKLLFNKFNYYVEVVENLNKEMFHKKLSAKALDESLKNHDIFVMIIMSHGVEDHVMTSDGQYLSYDEILNLFSNEHCPQLIGKPKVFIFNCCRANKRIEQKTVVDSAESPSKTFSDILLVFSTLKRKYLKYCCKHHRDIVD